MAKVIKYGVEWDCEHELETADLTIRKKKGMLLKEEEEEILFTNIKKCHICQRKYEHLMLRNERLFKALPSFGWGIFFKKILTPYVKRGNIYGNYIL